MAVRGIRLDQPARAALFGATRVLKDRGLPEVAKFALQRLQPSQQSAPTIVVVGEVKRGKSSLVNALLGHPGLSPVGVEVATNSFLRFAPPTDDLPEATARAILAGERRFIPLADIADWAAVGGRHADADGDDEPVVRGVEVGVTARYLPGIEIIDTPGVGGLSSSHAEVAKHSATWASLLLFVSDAGQPLTSNELAFLASLSETVDGVVLALTKKDLYPTGWREIHAENRKLLRRHAPRFAEVEMFAVSSQLATRVDTVDNPATRAALLTASGLPELADALVARAGDSETTSVANALRTVRSGLDQVTAQLEVRRQAAAGSVELLDDLKTERARLERLADQQSRWNLDLDRDMGRIRAEAIAGATREFNAIRDRWTAQIAKQRQAMKPSGRRQMMSQISFELEAAANRVAGVFYQHLYQVVHALFADAANAESMFSMVSFELGRLHPPPRPLRPSGVSKMDPSLVTTAFFGISMAKGMFGAALAGASILSPFVLPLAGGWLAVNFTYRVVKGGRVQLQSWMQDSIQAIQTELTTTTDNVIRDFRPEIVVGFREYLASATSEVKASIREAELAAAASRKERDQRVASLDRHLAAVDATRADVDRVLAGLADASARSAPGLATQLGPPVAATPVPMKSGRPGTLPPWPASDERSPSAVNGTDRTQVASTGARQPSGSGRVSTTLDRPGGEDLR